MKKLYLLFITLHVIVLHSLSLNARSNRENRVDFTMVALEFSLLQFHKNETEFTARVKNRTQQQRNINVGATLGLVTGLASCAFTHDKDMRTKLAASSLAVCGTCLCANYYYDSELKKYSTKYQLQKDSINDLIQKNTVIIKPTIRILDASAYIPGADEYTMYSSQEKGTVRVHEDGREEIISSEQMNSEQQWQMLFDLAQTDRKN